MYIAIGHAYIKQMCDFDGMIVNTLLRFIWQLIHVSKVLIKAIDFLNALIGAEHYFCCVCHSIRECVSCIYVIDKINVGSFTDNNIMELLRESVLMYKFNHPNVLPLVGICLDAGPSPYIVLPYMENGSLLSYVKKNRCSLLTSNETDEEEVRG